MGTVHLTQGHHGLFIRHPEASFVNRVPLDDELLARPILGDYGHQVHKSTQMLTRGALKGLLRLKGFGAAVSYSVVENAVGTSFISIPSRVWGEIYLDDNPRDIVESFSHDTRHTNHPFHNLAQWLEEEYDTVRWSEEEEDAFNKFALKWSDPAKWQAFFEERIQQAAKEIRKSAGEHRDKAAALVARAEQIQNNIDIS